jgi:hypothetical protein
MLQAGKVWGKCIEKGKRSGVDSRLKKQKG